MKLYEIDLSPTGPLSGVTLIANDIMTGTWSTSGINNPGNGNQQGISHLSIYNSLIPNNSTPEIPLPAALPLFLSAMGWFGFLGWRRRRAASA